MKYNTQFLDSQQFNEEFLMKIKHIIEAYLNAALHCSTMQNQIDLISRSFTKIDLRDVLVLTIARTVQRTLLLTFLDRKNRISER